MACKSEGQSLNDCVIKSARNAKKKDGMDWLGSNGGCDTHEPIPNSIVKPSSADDTPAQA